jgi:hypothetical protein
VLEQGEEAVDQPMRVLAVGARAERDHQVRQQPDGAAVGALHLLQPLLDLADVLQPGDHLAGGRLERRPPVGREPPGDLACHDALAGAGGPDDRGRAGRVAQGAQRLRHDAVAFGERDIGELPLRPDDAGPVQRVGVHGAHTVAPSRGRRSRRPRVRAAS